MEVKQIEKLRIAYLKAAADLYGSEVLNVNQLIMCGILKSTMTRGLIGQRI